MGVGIHAQAVAEAGFGGELAVGEGGEVGEELGGGESGVGVFKGTPGLVEAFEELGAGVHGWWMRRGGRGFGDVVL